MARYIEDPAKYVVIDGILLPWRRIPSSEQVLFNCEIDFNRESYVYTTYSRWAPQSPFIYLTLETRHIISKASRVQLTVEGEHGDEGWSLVTEDLKCHIEHSFLDPNKGQLVGLDRIPSHIFPGEFFNFERYEGRWFTKLKCWRDNEDL